MNTEQFEPQAQLFKALTHPARLAILEILRGGEQCVCHLEAVLGLRQAYISQQLAVLREAGLVADRRDGWNSFYGISEPRIAALLDTALGIAGPAPAAPRRRARAGRAAGCRCPKCSPAAEQTAC